MRPCGIVYAVRDSSVDEAPVCEHLIKSYSAVPSEGRSENRCGELGSLNKYYHYYYIIIIPVMLFFMLYNTIYNILFIMPYVVVLTCKSVDEALVCDHSNGSY